MSRNSRLTWRQKIPIAALLFSMVVGLIFGILGKNPFDPDGIIWGVHPQIDLFLWISAAAFSVAVVLSYIIWPLVKVETTRKERPAGNGQQSFWYENKNMLKSYWLAYMLLLPGLCISQMCRDLAVISHLDVFTWLGAVAFLVAMSADIVALVLMIKGFRQREKERKMHQQVS